MRSVKRALDRSGLTAARLTAVRLTGGAVRARAALSFLLLVALGAGSGCATGRLAPQATEPPVGRYSLYELSMPPDDGRLAAELQASRRAAAEARRQGRPCPAAARSARLAGALAVNCYGAQAMDPLIDPEPTAAAPVATDDYRALRQRSLTAERASGLSGMTGRIELRRAWSASDLQSLSRFQ
ncbi:MAG: hypothetical protein IPG96_09450 [Proteobacteria bacterium]|nr:hypothetical protein [Pseudomonadota bacterium]